MKSFVYNGQPARVVFGAGSLQHLAREIDMLGARKALVLSTPEQRASAEMIADLLGALTPLWRRSSRTGIRNAASRRFAALLGTRRSQSAPTICTGAVLGACVGIGRRLAVSGG